MQLKLYRSATVGVNLKGYKILMDPWLTDGEYYGSWSHYPYFDLNGKLPELNSNIKPVIGWVDDTLDDFLKKHNPKINFVHMDMDTYSPTKFTLEKIKPYLVKGSVIVFDELYQYIGWEEGEYKALYEVFNEDEFSYLAFNINGGNVSIQIN